MAGAYALRSTPSLVRPFLQWFLPPMKRLRQHVRDADRLIQPEVQMRRARAKRAMENGAKPPKTADTIGWMYELSREKGRREELNYVAAQLSLTMAAVHTTTEAITTALIDLTQHPEIVVPVAGRDRGGHRNGGLDEASVVQAAEDGFLLERESKIGFW